MTDYEPGSLEQAKNDPDGYLEWWAEMIEMDVCPSYMDALRLNHVAHALKAERDAWREYAERLESSVEEDFTELCPWDERHWKAVKATRPDRKEEGSDESS